MKSLAVVDKYKIVKHRVIMVALLSVLASFILTSESCELKEQNPVYSFEQY